MQAHPPDAGTAATFDGVAADDTTGAAPAALGVVAAGSVAAPVEPSAITASLRPDAGSSESIISKLQPGGGPAA